MYLYSQCQGFESGQLFIDSFIYQLKINKKIKKLFIQLLVSLLYH